MAAVIQARLDGSPFVAAVDGARRGVPGWAAAAIGLGLPWLTARVLADAAIPALLMIHNDSPPVEAGLRTAGLLLAVLGPLCLAAALSIWIVERRGPRAKAAPPALSAPWGALVGGGGFALALALTALASTTTVTRQTLPLLTLALPALLVAFQTGAEELFFRGWLQPILSARWGEVVGLITGALIFAVAHAAGGLSPLSLLNDSLAGLLFGLLATRTGGLAAPFAAHFAWNFCEAHLFGALPSPSPLGSAFLFHFSGAPLWTGGAEGFNGALSATIALAAGAAIAGLLGPRWRQQRQD